MKKILNAIILLFLVSHVKAEIVVIGNKNNTLSLNSVQVEDIFMGRNRALSNGSIAIPLEQMGLRAAFYKKLLNSSVEQVDAYWQTIELTNQLFSKNSITVQLSPKILSDDAEVLDAVSANKNNIGYIDKSNLNNSVRVLLIID